MDEFHIQQLLNIYSEAASVADWDRTIATFMPDGIWKLSRSGRTFEGYAAISDALKSFTAPFEYVIQLNAPGVIAVDGDTATARSTLRETGKFRDRDEAMEAFGVYDDLLVRTHEGWKFAQRSFALGWMHRVPILSN